MSLSTKIGSLFIRTLAKPISSSLKNQAANHESFKRVCVSVAQGLHSFEGRMRSNLLGQKQHNRPLSEARAIQQGANTLSEGFLFFVAAALILGEAWRSSKKETSRREDVQDRLETLESGIRKVIEENQTLGNGLKKMIEDNNTLVQNNKTLRTAITKFTTSDTFQEAQQELKSYLNTC